MKKKARTMRKVLLTVFSAMLLVCVTIGATVAYLTSTATVTNTFTVGKVGITMNEADVDVYGKVEKNEDGTVKPRVTTNEYKLMPGHTYTKDPTIYVNSDSENCYLFVQVVNSLGNMEGATTIADQMSAKGWKAVSNVANVYIYAGTDEGSTKLAVAANAEVKVFDTFTIADNVTTVSDPGDIVITAYAVQADGFDQQTPEAIWTTAFGN